MIQSKNYMLIKKEEFIRIITLLEEGFYYIINELECPKAYEKDRVLQNKVVTKVLNMMNKYYTIEGD